MRPLLLNRFGCRRNPDKHFSTSETCNEHEQTYVEAAILISSGRLNDNSTALRNVTALKLIMRSLRDVSVTLRKIVVASDEVAGFTFSSLYSASRANERINGRAFAPKNTPSTGIIDLHRSYYILHLRRLSRDQISFQRQRMLSARVFYLSLSPPSFSFSFLSSSLLTVVD